MAPASSPPASTMTSSRGACGAAGASSQAPAASGAPSAGVAAAGMPASPPRGAPDGRRHARAAHARGGRLPRGLDGRRHGPREARHVQARPAPGRHGGNQAHAARRERIGVVARAEVGGSLRPNPPASRGRRTARVESQVQRQVGLPHPVVPRHHRDRGQREGDAPPSRRPPPHAAARRQPRHRRRSRSRPHRLPAPPAAARRRPAPLPARPRLPAPSHQPLGRLGSRPGGWPRGGSCRSRSWATRPRRSMMRGYLLGRGLGASPTSAARASAPRRPRTPAPAPRWPSRPRRAGGRARRSRRYLAQPPRAPEARFQSRRGPMR